MRQPLNVSTATIRVIYIITTILYIRLLSSYDNLIYRRHDVNCTTSKMVQATKVVYAWRMLESMEPIEAMENMKEVQHTRTQVTVSLASLTSF